MTRPGTLARHSSSLLTTAPHSCMKASASSSAKLFHLATLSRIECASFLAFNRSSVAAPDAGSRHADESSARRRIDRSRWWVASGAGQLPCRSCASNNRRRSEAPAASSVTATDCLSPPRKRQISAAAAAGEAERGGRRGGGAQRGGQRPLRCPRNQASPRARSCDPVEILERALRRHANLRRPPYILAQCGRQ